MSENFEFPNSFLLFLALVSSLCERKFMCNRDYVERDEKRKKKVLSKTSNTFSVFHNVRYLFIVTTSAIGRPLLGINLPHRRPLPRLLRRTFGLNHLSILFHVVSMPEVFRPKGHLFSVVYGLSITTIYPVSPYLYRHTFQYI